MREQGMTHGAIAQFYEEKGIKTSLSTIRERCKKIYENKGKKEPKLKKRRKIKRNTEGVYLPSETEQIGDISKNLKQKNK